MKKKKTRTHDNSSKYYKLFVFASWFISSRVKVFALVLNSRSKIEYLQKYMATLGHWPNIALAYWVTFIQSMQGVVEG